MTTFASTLLFESLIALGMRLQANNASLESERETLEFLANEYQVTLDWNQLDAHIRTQAADIKHKKEFPF